MSRFHSTSDGLVPYTPEEEAAADTEMVADAWVGVRTIRDRLLRESDWITLRAYSRGEQLTTDWANYQQALRDITQQPDPLSITWPAKPSS